MGDEMAIEVKAKTRVSARDITGLKALREEGVHKKFYLVSHDPVRQTIDGVECLYWMDFVRELWG